MPLDVSGHPSASVELPVNIEAEQALLGSILLQNGVYHRVSDTLRDHHFGNPVHGRIYAACAKLIERGSLANAITLKNLFDQDGALRDIGGVRYLAKLIDCVVSLANAPHYATAIIECWRRGQIITIAEELIRRSVASDLDMLAPALVEEAEAMLSGVLETDVQVADVGPRKASVAAQASIEQSEAAYRGDADSAILSGIGALDRITGGFQQGDLIYIGKRPSMGGTAFAVTLAINAAKAGKHVGLWSAEMSAERIARRMLAHLTGVSTRMQRSGDLQQADWHALINAKHEIDGLPIYIDDTAPLGTATLRRRARQMQRRGELGLVIVDYLQLLRPGDGRGDMPLKDAVPAVSAALRELAKELNVPIVCLAQLTPDIDNRENKRPRINDIRWTHDAEQDAAVMAMLYRDEYYLASAEPHAGTVKDPLKLDQLHAQWSTALAASRGRAELIVVKSRDDGTGTANVGFDPVRSLFSDDIRPQGDLW